MTDWAVAWRSLVEAGDPRIARRLHQGRGYHRAGRVSDLRIQPGGASVRVQGERATPYNVEVSVPELDNASWERVIDTLAGQVRHTARLLAGHAPESLDTELAGTGVHVVPAVDELRVACDCGDETWPCAHAAALWEALAELMESDPFVLLRIRGRGRERLLSELAEARRRRSRGAVGPGVPLEALDATRWTGLRAPIDDLGVPAPERPRTPAGTLRLLGDPPGWSGGLGAWGLLHPLVEGAGRWIEQLDEPEV